MITSSCGSAMYSAKHPGLTSPMKPRVSQLPRRSVRQAMQFPHVTMGLAVTRSPAWSEWTLLPVFMTVPENSCPMVSGIFWINMPFL